MNEEIEPPQPDPGAGTLAGSENSISISDTVHDGAVRKKIDALRRTRNQSIAGIIFGFLLSLSTVIPLLCRCFGNESPVLFLICLSLFFVGLFNFVKSRDKLRELEKK